MKETHRGITTITNRKHERTPKTITNRFNQISLSLPRIDDKKRWAGYAGLTGISRKLARIIPKCNLYIEPFAGTAKVFQELRKIQPYKYSKAILNDKAEYIYEWLKANFPNEIIEKKDFTYILETWDDKDNFIMLDQPWNRGNYKQSFSCFDRKSTQEYDEEVLLLCKKLKARFIITTRKENTRMLNSEFNNYLIQSEYVVSGRYPKVLLTTNMELRGLEKAKADPFE